MLESITLPTSESAFSAYLPATDNTPLPPLLHVLCDIYYANDPLDVNSKHWVWWIIEQMVALSKECKSSMEYYTTTYLHTTSSATPATTTTTTTSNTTKNTTPTTKLNTAQSKAMLAMQAQADKFKSMFGDVSDSEDSDNSDSEGAMDTSTNNTTTNTTTNNTTTNTTNNTAPTPTVPLTAAQLARERALKAMQANATTFAAMMGSDSDSDSDDEGEGSGGGSGSGSGSGGKGYSVDVNVNSCDVNGNCSSSKVSSKGNNVVNIGNSSSVRGGGNDSDNEMNVEKPIANKHSTTTGATTAHTTTPPTTHSTTPIPTNTNTTTSTEETPVCIICQADANTEGTNGNVRTLGYLALLQASTTLCHSCVDSSAMYVSATLPQIHMNVAPKQLSSEVNTHISFCGHGKYSMWT